MIEEMVDFLLMSSASFIGAYFGMVLYYRRRDGYLLKSPLGPIPSTIYSARAPSTQDNLPFHTLWIQRSSVPSGNPNRYWLRVWTREHGHLWQVIATEEGFIG